MARCVYCQLELKTRLDLAHHIIEAHKGTYAEANIKDLTGYTKAEASQ